MSDVREIKESVERGVIPIFDKIDQEKRNDDREHETDLERFVDEKIFPAILSHKFFPRR